MKKVKWHFRNNKRRNNSKNKGKHPSLIFGKTDDDTKYYNIGLTHSKRRGHHSNIEISDPSNWNRKSYLRNDVRIDDINQFEEMLNNYIVNPKDKDKVIKIIDSFIKKNNIK